MNMENPGILLRRARELRRFRGASEPAVLLHSQPRESPAAPLHQSSHANYSALMRSHDRMRTRHIAGQGGQSGA